jgi:hypothetical protein
MDQAISILVVAAWNMVFQPLVRSMVVSPGQKRFVMFVRVKR